MYEIMSIIWLYYDVRTLSGPIKWLFNQLTIIMMIIPWWERPCFHRVTSQWSRSFTHNGCDKCTTVSKRYCSLHQQWCGSLYHNKISRNCSHSSAVLVYKLPNHTLFAFVSIRFCFAHHRIPPLCRAVLSGPISMLQNSLIIFENI